MTVVIIFCDVQRDDELLTAAERVRSLQECLNSIKNICRKHRDRLVYGSGSVSADLWDRAASGDEQSSFLGQAAGDSVTNSTENCLLCDFERLSSAEIVNVQLAAENRSMKKWVQEADELVYQTDQRIAQRDGRMANPRMRNSGSFVERLRLFDAAVARVMAEYDRITEAKQHLERLVAQHENSIALLQQQLRDAVAGTFAVDELLRQERDLGTATTNELKNAQKTITMLEDSLRKKSAELDEAAVKFDQLRSEAKSRIRDLKLQLEAKQQECTELSADGDKLNAELVHVNGLLAVEKENVQQLNLKLEEKRDQVCSCSLSLCNPVRDLLIVT